MHSNTLQYLMYMVRDLINEPTQYYWLDTTLIKYINDGIQILTNNGLAYKDIVTATTTPFVREVSYDGIMCHGVEYENNSLIKITPLQIGHVKTNGYIPQFYYEAGGKIHIEPIPPFAYSLTLYVTKAVEGLSELADAVTLPASLCVGLPFYAAAKALEQDKKYGPASLMMQIFVNALARVIGASQNVPDGVEDVRVK